MSYVMHLIAAAQMTPGNKFITSNWLLKLFLVYMMDNNAPLNTNKDITDTS